MSKGKEPIITVNTVFAGQQTDRQAFIDLIIHKKHIDKTQCNIDISQNKKYTKITPKLRHTQQNGG